MSIFASDNFTDTDDTTLASHTPSGGGSWTQHGSHTGEFVVTSNRARLNGGFNSALYYHSADPGGSNPAEYDVAVAITELSDLDGQYGPAGRIATGANTAYWIRVRQLGGGTTISLALMKTVGGTTSTLSSGSAFAVEAGTALLELRDSLKRALWNGAEQATSADNEITAAGKAGFTDRGSNAGASTGMHFDNFEATDLAAGGGVIADDDVFPRPRFGEFDPRYITVFA